MTSTEHDWRSKAEANLLQARQRRGARLGSKKSRQGCLTCKSRRVKCDETRPACQRCLDGGRDCRYGPSPSGSQTSSEASSPLHTLSVLQTLGIKEADWRTFDYFVSHTASRVAGIWDKNFWCDSMLQVAHDQPFIVDSLLAISVLYEHPQYLASFTGKPGEGPHPEYPGTSYEGTPVPDQHLALALKHYNHAIQRFMLEMQRGTASPTVVLLSCVLFICVEMIRDNVLAAMGLFVQATKLINDLDREKLSIDEYSMLQLIEALLQRMAVQAVFFGYPIGPFIATTKEGSMRDSADARKALFALTMQSYSFVWEADAFRHDIMDARVDSTSSFFDGTDDYMHGMEVYGITEDPKSVFYSPQDDNDYEAQMERHGAFDALRRFFDHLRVSPNGDTTGTLGDLLRRRSELLLKLEAWKAEFELLLKIQDSEGQVNEAGACDYLWLYYLASVLWVGTRLETQETVFDKLTPTFEGMIQHAQGYVRASGDQSPTFTFEIGAVLPLFLVTTKCRTSSLRRRALDLMLQCPRKESTFGAYSCAQAACRLINVEEEGLGLPLADLSGRAGEHAVSDEVKVPENQRVHLFDLLKNRKKRVYEIRVTRYREEGGRFGKVVENFPIV